MQLEKGENISQLAEDNIENVDTEFELPPDTPKPAPKFEHPRNNERQQNIERPKNPERNKKPAYKKNSNRNEETQATNLFDNKRKGKINKKDNRQHKTKPKGRRR